MALSETRKKWLKDNTVFIGMRLQRTTDRDILEWLDGAAKQTEIKRLIRIGMEQEKTAKKLKMGG